MPKEPTYVTQPFLPPLEEFIPYLEKIWESKTLTNGGPFHQALESALCKYLGVEFLSLFSNATIALITALQALDIQGEVITTPYSFVATSHALLWHGNTPVFVDIDPASLNMDPSKIEAAITPNTRAILPVHCYGNPCNFEAIQEIAVKYNLKIIYDAAHAFAVDCNNSSLLNEGDLSVLSFHATKVFNTFEGGAIVSKDAKTKQHIDHLKNFGFINETTVIAPGINGKMSEFNSALGLLQLKYIDEVIESRRQIDKYYRENLKGVNGVECLQHGSQTRSNYSYFPIFVKSGFPLSRDMLYEHLRSQNIFARRYFYPLISEFPMYRSLASSNPMNLPHATQATGEVLCLPIFPDLKHDELDRIIALIKSV